MGSKIDHAHVCLTKLLLLGFLKYSGPKLQAVWLAGKNTEKWLVGTCLSSLIKLSRTYEPTLFTFLMSFFFHFRKLKVVNFSIEVHTHDKVILESKRKVISWMSLQTAFSLDLFLLLLFIVNGTFVLRNSCHSMRLNHCLICIIFDYFR